METEGVRRFEKQIIGEVWTSAGIYANVGRLCDCGSRFAGTDGARLARDLIQDHFETHGLQRVRLATFDFLTWQRGEASLDVVSPREQRLCSAISLVYSPNMLPGGLRTEVVDLGMGTKQ